MRIGKQSQIQILAEPPLVSGAGGYEHLPGSDGVTTRARWTRRCLADPPLPCTRSGRPRKQSTLGLWSFPGGPQSNIAPHHKLRRRSIDGARSTGDPEVTNWRDWANLLTEFIEDIAGRLLSLDVSEYLRFRAVCKPWCKLKLFSTSHLISLVDGLLVLCDKATNVVRLLHPLTGALAEFPDITDVRGHIGAGPNARLVMDAFKSMFPGLEPEHNAFATDSFIICYPASNAVLTSAGINESTSPPTLQLCFRDESWLVICAKPGDEHWVALYPSKMWNNRLTMIRYTYRCAGRASSLDCSLKSRSPVNGP
ncbi:hypothetical protein ACQ4PT_065270 [Festuca glaucescens]